MKDDVDRELMELPQYARPTAAAARNASLKIRAANETILENSPKLKAHLRKLHITHGVSKYKLARLVGLSESRIRQLLGPAGKGNR